MKKLKQLTIRIPNRKVWSDQKHFCVNPKVSLCTYKDKQVKYPYQLKLLIGKSIATDWNLYLKQSKQIRNKGYKQKIVILQNNVRL